MWLEMRTFLVQQKFLQLCLDVRSRCKRYTEFLSTQRQDAALDPSGPFGVSQCDVGSIDLPGFSYGLYNHKLPEHNV